MMKQHTRLILDPRSLRGRCMAALLGALAGCAVFLLVYGTATLHTSWDSWILNGYDEWDVQQHYAGWLLFRNSHWGFPLGLADTLAAPDGTVISYTDSLPWVSIALKLLRGVLPATFQWFGWYTLICFALQGAAGALLCVRGSKSSGMVYGAVALLGGALFACLPTLWERAFRHVALASQWIMLFALYAYLEYRTALAAGRTPVPWEFPVLAFVAVGIHPYFLPLVMVCALLAAVERGRTGRGKNAWGRGAVQFVVSVAAALCGGLLCGALGGGSGVSRDGYGEFSMNLNAMFNPTSRGGYRWSRVLPVQGQIGGQYDGFNYLGLGVLLLVGIALAVALVGTLRDRTAAKQWWHRNAPLVAACAFLTLFAASHVICWGGTELCRLPMPQSLLNLCGIFRSSGRMFYLVGACMLLFGVYTLRRFGGKALCAGLALTLLVQCGDLSAVAAEKHAKFEEPVRATVVEHPETATLGVGHTRLLATGEVREDRLRLLAILAGKQGLATNLDIAVSGSHPQAEASRREAGEQLQSGAYDPTAVYVTTDGEEWERWQQIFAEEPGVGFFVADSCYFMVPPVG